jgi:hypothetical protein
MSRLLLQKSHVNAKSLVVENRIAAVELSNGRVRQNLSGEGPNNNFLTVGRLSFDCGACH